jgi:hypothetical protein
MTASGPGSPLTITGLVAGITYTVTVTATNSAGTGPASAPSQDVTIPTSSDPGFKLLAWSDSSQQYVDVETGYLFDLNTGQETDPLDGTIKVPAPGSVPPYKLITLGTQVVTYDQFTGRYYTFRVSTIDPTTMLEYDQTGNAIAQDSPPLYMITTDLTCVDYNDQTSVLDCETLTLLNQSPYTLLQTPVEWTYP